MNRFTQRENLPAPILAGILADSEIQIVLPDELTQLRELQGEHERLTGELHQRTPGQGKRQARAAAAELALAPTTKAIREFRASAAALESENEVIRTAIKSALKRLNQDRVRPLIAKILWRALVVTQKACAKQRQRELMFATRVGLASQFQPSLAVRALAATAERLHADYLVAAGIRPSMCVTPGSPQSQLADVFDIVKGTLPDDSRLHCEMPDPGAFEISASELIPPHQLSAMSVAGNAPGARPHRALVHNNGASVSAEAPIL